MSDSSSSQPFESLLPTGRERFLAQVMAHALQEGWVSGDDFLRHFPPAKLVESLAEVDDLRVSLLVKAAKVHERAASKKSIESASEDLAIAVSERICEPSEILQVYGADDRVTYLSATELWAFATEGEWWAVSGIDRDFQRVLGRLAFMVERALGQNLMTLHDLADALTFEEIAGLLPEARLQDVVRHALTTGREGKVLDEKSLLSVVPLPELLGLFDLAEVWNRVVLGVVAKPNDLVGSGEDADEVEKDAKAGAKVKPAAKRVESARPAVSAKPSAVRTSVAPRTTSAAPGSSRPGAVASSAMSRSSVAPKPPVPPGAPIKALSVPPPPPPPGGDGDEARAEVISRLNRINRLPPSHANLALALLMSIDTMYADLDMADSDDAREDAIREAFPNHVQLRLAMLSLIELLDPTINTQDPLIRDAEVDSLIKIVMFEERRRR